MDRRVMMLIHPDPDLLSQRNKTGQEGQGFCAILYNIWVWIYNPMGGYQPAAEVYPRKHGENRSC